MMDLANNKTQEDRKPRMIIISSNKIMVSI
jgi:hypothetical protein